MFSSQPYSQRFVAVAGLIALLITAACGGSTNLTSVSGPSAVRCQTTLSVDSTSVPAAGGAVTIAVSAERECSWTASTDSQWLQLSVAGGQGPGSLVATAAENPTATVRSASVSVNDQRVTLTQEPRPCTFSLASSSAQMSHEGGRGTISVSTFDGCAWHADTDAAWVQISGDARSGPGSVPFDVEPNEGPRREAVVTVADLPFTIVQNARPALPPPPPPPPPEPPPPPPEPEPPPVPEPPAPACTFSLSPVTSSVGASGGEGRFSVTTQPGCSWVVTTDAPWIALVQRTGRGSGEAVYVVHANPATSPRSAAISLGSHMHTVNQQGAVPVCAYALEPSLQHIAAAGGTGGFAVVTPAGCAWSAASSASWVSITVGAGSGPGDVVYTASQNTVTSPRSATITVGGQVHTIEQAAAAPICTYSLQPPSQSIVAAGGEARFAVVTQEGCAWAVSTEASWVAVTSGEAGSGPGDVVYIVQPNPDTAPRSAALMVEGQSHTVSQAAGSAP